MLFYVFSDGPDFNPWKADVIRRRNFYQLDDFVDAVNSGRIAEDIDCVILLLYTLPRCERKKMEEKGNEISGCSLIIFFLHDKSPRDNADFTEQIVEEYLRKRPKFS